jgi:small subunit ribosomal protein S15
MFARVARTLTGPGSLMCRASSSATTSSFSTSASDDPAAAVAAAESAAEEGSAGASSAAAPPRYSATRAALADAGNAKDAKMDAKLFPEFPGVAAWQPAEDRRFVGGLSSAELDEQGASEEVRRLFDLHNASQMERNKQKMDDAITRFRMHENDVGSTPVQCAVLTERIRYMTVHLQEHRKDNHGRRGLQTMLNKRRSLLKYLRKKDFDVYKTTITALKLKDTYY